MREIIDACIQLNDAFMRQGLESPALISVEPETFQAMKAIGHDIASHRYTAQGLEVVQISGIKFTDKLPQGYFHPKA